MRLTSEQVADRLDVKTETIYSYVSRGLLHPSRADDGKGSLFDPEEVERLATRRARDRRHKDRGPGVRSAITAIKDGRLYYRGIDATKLAVGETFEGVAGWLWNRDLDSTRVFGAPPEMLDLAQVNLATLPTTTRHIDRLRVIIAVAASADPFRFNIQPEAVIATGKAIVGVMVDALPLEGGKPFLRDRHDLATRLWPRLTTKPVSEQAIGALNAALILMADHGLATSTFAARVAASSRANPYAVVAAGLSAFDGPLHGAAATHAYQILKDAIKSGDPMGVYAERLRTAGTVAGFFPRGHRHYPNGDIRAATLLSLVDELPVPPKMRRAMDGLIDAAARGASRPGIELALAALAHACQMRPDAGEAIFAIARTAGWIAHALEEYEEPGLRFRVEGTYTGEPIA
jgi:citrate synthase